MKNAIMILYGELILCIVIIFVVIAKGPRALFEAIKYGLFFIRTIFGV